MGMHVSIAWHCSWVSEECANVLCEWTGSSNADPDALSPEALSHLKTYKYQSVDKSFVSRYVLKHYVRVKWYPCMTSIWNIDKSSAETNIGNVALLRQLLTGIFAVELGCRASAIMARAKFGHTDRIWFHSDKCPYVDHCYAWSCGSGPIMDVLLFCGWTMDVRFTHMDNCLSLFP